MDAVWKYHLLEGFWQPERRTAPRRRTEMTTAPNGIVA